LRTTTRATDAPDRVRRARHECHDALRGRSPRRFRIHANAVPHHRRARCTRIPRSGVASAIDCLHYALSLPTTVVINGCETIERLEQALEAARTFKPLSGAQMAALREKTKEVARTGRLEKFKTSNIFDGTAKNPQWMG